MAGIILLVFIAALIAFFYSRIRRRMGMGTTPGKTWVVVMAVVILAVLAIWAYSTQS